MCKRLDVQNLFKANKKVAKVVKFDGKLLLVIDDYETFSKENKDKIELFIQKLNTNHHKVLVTTHAANINLGMTFHNNEKFKINEQHQAIEFLYGRLYDYLSAKAKNIFVVLSLLVDSKNTVNVIEKAKYLASMENDDDGFFTAVGELEQLKIIRFCDEDNKFFEVYSLEILQMMNDYFQKRDANFKRSCISRKEQINKDRNLDVEHSLLLSADLNRDTKNEIEVIESYKQILNRTTSPNDVKMLRTKGQFSLCTGNIKNTTRMLRFFFNGRWLLEALKT